MKIFITTILIALLTACGSCEIDDAKSSEFINPAQAQQPAVEPSVAVTNPTVTPDPVKCSDEVTTECYIEICPKSSGDTSCGPSPYPYTPRVGTEVTPDPTPVCVRDTTPLVFVDPFWVDNCGNKYGQVTF